MESCELVRPLYIGKGARDELDNYRPFSNLNPLSKIFESILAKQRRNDFEFNNLFFEEQFGLREKKSCEHELMTMVEDWREVVVKRLVSAAVFIDLRKAFDTVISL